MDNLIPDLGEYKFSTNPIECICSLIKDSIDDSTMDVPIKLLEQEGSPIWNFIDNYVDLGLMVLGAAALCDTGNDFFIEYLRGSVTVLGPAYSIFRSEVIHPEDSNGRLNRNFCAYLSTLCALGPSAIGLESEFKTVGYFASIVFGGLAIVGEFDRQRESYHSERVHKAMELAFGYHGPKK